MSDFDFKKKALEKLGVNVLPGNYKNIFLKYKKTTIPYDTQSFLMYNANYLINDISKKFEIDEMEDDFIKKLNIKKEYLKKLKIDKLWLLEDFYLSKDNVKILYDFDDYIDMEPDLFIADVKNKFNRLEALSTFKGTVVTDDSSIIIGEYNTKSETKIDNFSEMKKNIRKILTEKGLIEKC